MAAVYVETRLKMEITPDFTAKRFSHLKPGELFFLPVDSRYVVALAAADPYEENMVAVLLGPGRETAGRIMSQIHANVLSLGSEYELRLPAAPSGWSANEPTGEGICFVLSASGREASEQTLFLKASFVVSPQNLLRCYIDIRSGQVLVDRERRAPYIAPTGICGYAVEWSLFTKESKPRLLLSYSTEDSGDEPSRT